MTKFEALQYHLEHGGPKHWDAAERIMLGFIAEHTRDHKQLEAYIRDKYTPLVPRVDINRAACEQWIADGGMVKKAEIAFQAWADRNGHWNAVIALQKARRDS